MSAPAPTTRLNTSAAATVLQLKASPIILGVASPTLTLTSQDGNVTLRAPLAMFNIPIDAGDLIVCSITLMRTVVEPIDPFAATLLKGLDS